MNNSVDWTKPLQTRDGRKVVLLEVSTNALGNPKYTVVYKTLDCWSAPLTLPADGAISAGYDSHDIINVPEEKTKTFWVNLLPGGVTAYLTRTGADLRNDGREACVEVTVKYKVGEGLGK